MNNKNNNNKGLLYVFILETIFFSFCTAPETHLTLALGYMSQIACEYPT